VQSSLNEKKGVTFARGSIILPHDPDKIMVGRDPPMQRPHKSPSNRPAYGGPLVRLDDRGQGLQQRIRLSTICSMGIDFA